MKRATCRFLATVLTLSIAGSAWGADIDRRKGLGFASAIGGPAGLAFSYGIGNLTLETIVGMSRSAYPDDEPEPVTFFAGGVGVHFFLLSAQNAAMTIGARGNLGTGTASVEIRDASGVRQKTEQKEVTQFGFDVPLRVYWFPTRHISIHTEFGIAVYLGATDALIFRAEDGDVSLAPDGLAIVAFRNSSPFGLLGLTYWW
jgi:hypothetical protein